MNLKDFKQLLGQHSGLNLRFLLPDESPVPAHAHVTEVARIDKRFIDCGGTLRTDTLCRLQTWVSDDFHHRLTAGRLLGILDKAEPILQTDDLDVDVEHEAKWISQFPIVSGEAQGHELVLRLGERHTACLAEDQCKRPPAGLPAFNAQSVQFKPTVKPS